MGHRAKRLGGWLNRFFFLFWFSFFSTIIPRPIQRVFTFSFGIIFYLIMPKTRRGVQANLRVIGEGRWSKPPMAFPIPTFKQTVIETK